MLFLYIDYAYKFNSNYPLVDLEDWIGGFKSYDETKDGICEIVSDNCPDINGDGTVNVSDLLQLIGAWGPCGGCDEDIDDSGEVDVTDLLMAIASWGDCDG